MMAIRTLNNRELAHFCCRNNLHICLCMSPVGSAFRNRCRMFPSLVNCCTIDWFTEWPPEALLSVSKYFFEHVDLGSDELKVIMRDTLSSFKNMLLYVYHQRYCLHIVLLDVSWTCHSD